MSIKKNVNNKKCATKWIHIHQKKKIERDSDGFWHRKLTLKFKFWYFLTPPGKNLSNFVPAVWKLHNPCCHNKYLTPHLCHLYSELQPIVEFFYFVTIGLWCSNVIHLYIGFKSSDDQLSVFQCFLISSNGCNQII